MQRLLFCRSDELRDGKLLVKRLLARRLAVLKRGERLIAFDAECRHMRAPLESDAVCGDILRCPWHGWEYDLESGKCLTTPGMNLRHHRVEISDDRVYLLIGSPEASEADQA